MHPCLGRLPGPARKPLADYYPVVLRTVRRGARQTLPFGLGVALLVAGLGALTGCGGRSTLSFTCKVPLEAQTSGGSVIAIGRCDGLLGGGVARVRLSQGQSVTIKLLQTTGFGPVTVSSSDSKVLDAIPSNGYLAVYIGRRVGESTLEATSWACPSPKGSKATPRCLIATVRVT